MLRKSKVTLLLNTLFVFVLNLPLFAQSLGGTTGTLAGNAEDESGVPLPGVAITVTGVTGSKSEVTNDKGAFIFPYITPGMYTLKAELCKCHNEIRWK
ncbi:carboxypeptidase-like regulatory domain-containing protein [bacterium]|nr:carboxypeptidase-like regulatory domain-containing protein [bacterium]MCI0616323.1 carboxypeptidase-like regulatory domain-containing protein [bacterium]